MEALYLPALSLLGVALCKYCLTTNSPSNTLEQPLLQKKTPENALEASCEQPHDGHQVRFMYPEVTEVRTYDQETGQIIMACI